MHSLKVSETISLGHRLPNYEGICSSPHGHNATFDVKVQSASFLDFKIISSILKAVLEPMDHAMVLDVSDPFLKVCQDMKFRVVGLTQEPTTETICQYVFNRMVHHTHDMMNVHIFQVTMHETSKYSATVITGTPHVMRVV